MAGVFPRRFGKYVLLKPLARGGMGEIYLAATGEPGLPEVLRDQEGHRREERPGRRRTAFSTRPRWCCGSSHANLVPTFDAGECDGEFYIAMELVEGKDLREIWNRCVRTRTRIPLDVALHVGREIARALAYVHSYGDLHLVHRDVAPPNILLSYFGEVKLTDFGLARSVLKQEHTAPGRGVRPRRRTWRPSRRAARSPTRAPTSTAWAIVLWELLTGHQYLQLASLDPATAMSLVRHPRPMAPSSEGAVDHARAGQAVSCGRWRPSARTASSRPRRCARRCPTSWPKSRRAPTPSGPATFVRSLYDDADRARSGRSASSCCRQQALAAAAARPTPTGPAPRRPRRRVHAAPRRAGGAAARRRPTTRSRSPRGRRQRPVPLAALDRAECRRSG